MCTAFHRLCSAMCEAHRGKAVCFEGLLQSGFMQSILSNLGPVVLIALDWGEDVRLGTVLCACRQIDKPHQSTNAVLTVATRYMQNGCNEA